MGQDLAINRYGCIDNYILVLKHKIILAKRIEVLLKIPHIRLQIVLVLHPKL